MPRILRLPRPGLWLVVPEAGKAFLAVVDDFGGFVQVGFPHAYV